jgi:hypothetical protein
MSSISYYDPETLFNAARDRGYDAVRQWYPSYWIFSVMPEGLQGGNPSARLAARAGAVSDLAKALNGIKTEFEKRRISIVQAVTAARPLVGATARMLWLTAHYVPNPFAAPLTFEEEFENYRVVATFLAMDLARMSAACYYAGGTPGPAVIPPAPAAPQPDEMLSMPGFAGSQSQQMLLPGSLPEATEQESNTPK